MNWKSGRVEEVEIQNSKVKSKNAFAWMVSRGGRAKRRAQLNETLYLFPLLAPHSPNSVSSARSARKVKFKIQNSKFKRLLL
jgi:hypothetical protein